MAVRAGTVLAFFFVWARAVAKVEEHVYRLEESTFDAVVKEFPAVMVQFYTPRCSGCQAMNRDFESAAKYLIKEDDGAVMMTCRLAKVDASREKGLAKRFGVTSYPTLLVFKDGELFGEYRGGRDEEDIISYMNTLISPVAWGAPMRAYFVAKGQYKEMIRGLSGLGGAGSQPREFLIALFPALIALPVLLLAYSCSGGKAPKKGERRGRSSGSKAQSGRGNKGGKKTD